MSDGQTGQTDLTFFSVGSTHACSILTHVGSAFSLSGLSARQRGGMAAVEREQAVLWLCLPSESPVGISLLCCPDLNTAECPKNQLFVIRRFLGHFVKCPPKDSRRHRSPAAGVANHQPVAQNAITVGPALRWRWLVAIGVTSSWHFSPRAGLLASLTTRRSPKTEVSSGSLTQRCPRTLCSQKRR